MILGETLTASIDPGLVLKIVNNVCTLPSRRLIDLALFLFLFFSWGFQERCAFAFAELLRLFFFPLDLDNCRNSETRVPQIER